MRRFQPTCPARRTAVLLATLALLAACTAGTGRMPATEGPSPRAEPWAQRPVVELGFSMAPDLTSAKGRETVLFTPDLRVCELVFRAWPNKPTAAEDGSSLTITEAVVDGRPANPRVSAAGAPEGAPGTLVELPLPQCVDAGTPVRAELRFDLALGPDAGERLGYSPSAKVAWFGTAFPLLAWVRGQGWTRDPAVDMDGETVTSEDFRLAELAVTAPSWARVLGSGSALGTATGPAAGTTVHRFGADAVRDLAVAVGRFEVVERRVGDVRLHVGVPERGSRVSADRWADNLERMTGRLEGFLGPYPYPDLWAAVLPTLDDGVEFPTALQFGDVGRQTVPALAAHEIAHMWFYSLVSNNQARDPWIDEAFATYAQARAADQFGSYRLSDVDDRVRGDLGQPMQHWAERGGFARFVSGVYDQGAAALIEGRSRVGEEAFDEALRGFVERNAHRVVGPADVEAAFRDLPEVADLLRDAGGLPENGAS